jgi:hypothetical protein
MMKIIATLFTALPLAVFAQIDRAGNVINDDNDSIPAGAFALLVISFVVLHFFGEDVLIKMWGVLFVIVVIIGIAKNF